MATATRSVPLPVTPPPAEITLTLSEAEARAILVLTAKVGGSPNHSPRRHIDAVGGALASALSQTYSEVPEFALAEGRLWFNAR